jgi:hypothetical protein
MKERGETLTDSMLAALPAHLRPVQAGKYQRAGCPFHGSDQQRSLSISTASGRFKCHSCGVWGYTEQSRSDWTATHGGQPARPVSPWLRRSGVGRLRPDPATAPSPLAPEWLARLQAWQTALPEAAGYLASRRIPLDLVRDMGGGVGVFGGGAQRLVLPHTDPTGAIVSLYGRRIDGGLDHKHHHLPGPRGWLNAPAVNGTEVWLTEGAFDALALRAAGVGGSVAVFGVDGLRWGWLRNVSRLVLAFDQDEAGTKARERHAREAHLRGIEVLALTEDELGGHKDVAAAWAAGALRLSGIAAPAAGGAPIDVDLERLQAHLSALPDTPPEGLRGEAWLDYRRQVARFNEHLPAAMAAGWTAAELFGLPHPRRDWEAGALWLLRDLEVLQVTGSEMVARTRDNRHQTAHRSTIKPYRLPWDGLPAL